MERHTNNAMRHLKEAKESLALAEEPEAYAEVSNLKRELEIKEDD
jgi:hypothetical protein